MLTIARSEDAATWQDQMNSASCMATVHGAIFQQLNWKVKKPEADDATIN